MENKRLSKEKRRKQIKDVALELFVNKGYAKTTMDEIVQAVGISKGGMYHHFAGKEEILFLDASRKKLTDYNLKQLVECITEVINCYNKDIDMEFGYNDGELYIVQVRDVTADF